MLQGIFISGGVAQGNQFVSNFYCNKIAINLWKSPEKLPST